MTIDWLRNKKYFLCGRFTALNMDVAGHVSLSLS